jgi:hypothetical protein
LPKSTVKSPEYSPSGNRDCSNTAPAVALRAYTLPCGPRRTSARARSKASKSCPAERFAYTPSL